MKPALAATVLLAAFLAPAAQPAPARAAGMSLEEELRIGREQHPMMLRQFGGEYESAALKAYVSALGQKIAAHAHRKELTYRFTVLNTPDVNAMAIAGGYVYVTRGLLALVASEAELAGVIGHELGHINAQHYGRHTEQELKAGVEVLGAGILTGREVKRHGGSIATLLMPHYRREQEHQADELGLRYAARAGYDPKAMETMLTKLRADTRLMEKIYGLTPDQIRQSNYMSTHPATDERITRVEIVAARTPVTGTAEGRDELLKHIDGMAFGDSAEQGFIRRRVFAHPGMRLRFEVPPGFRLVNTTDSVVAFGPEGSQIVFDEAEDPIEGSMTAYISHAFPSVQDRVRVDRLNVNSLDAATFGMQAKTDKGTQDVRVIAIRMDAQTIYRFVAVTPPGQTAKLAEGMRRMTYSFRRLTDEDIARLKPFRLRVVTVQTGDTVAALAARMPFVALREERFRTLNALRVRDRLKPGQKVKIVVE